MYSNPRTKLYNVLMGNTDTNNAIGRTAGAASSGDGGNFFTKKASSIGNAVGTTISAPISLAHDIGENIATQKFLGDSKARMKSIANKYGYDSWADWQDAYAEVKNSGDENRIAEMDEQLKEFQAQANANAEEATAKAKGYEDYRQNNLISKNINQDRGKFAGSAINTLSTATDLLGLTNGPVSNAVQGSIEGVADELEQNGLENFSWDRAKQNAIAGAATGAVVGGLNKGLSNSLAKKGGNLFKGSNKLTAGINSLGANHPLAATIATGAGRGALSGAAGGATGAGISAAMNGGDVLGSALQGAAQGAQQGAMAGSIMAGANMAINKTPGVGDFMQKVNQAQTDWENSGENFNERFANTINSGESNFGNTRFGQKIGSKVDSMYTDKINQNARARLANALTQSVTDEAQGGVTGDTKFVRLTDESLQDINTLRQAQGLNPLENRQVIAYENAVNNGLNKRVKQGGMTVDDVVNMAYESLMSPEAEALPGNVGSTNTMMVAPYKNRFNGSMIDNYEGTTSLKSIEPRSASKVDTQREIKNDLLRRSGSPLAANQEGGVTQTSSLEGSTSLGDEATPLRTRTSIIPQGEQNVNTTEAEVYRTMTGEAEPQVNIEPQRTSKEYEYRQKRNQKLLDQYDTIDKRTANATRAVETVGQIADAGFEKPADVEGVIKKITGSDGALNKLNRRIIASAGEINTMDGVDQGTSIDDFIDQQIRMNGLYGTNDGKAVASEIEAVLNKLPSRRDGSITGLDSAEDVFDVIQTLEKHSVNYKGKSGNNYSTSTPYKEQKAAVIDSLTTVLKDRVYDAADISQVGLPELVADMKSWYPNNKKWADWVDNNVATAKSGLDIRAAQAPFVRMGKIIDNGVANSGTFGSKMPKYMLRMATSNPLGMLMTGAEVLGDTSFGKRATAKIYDTLANRSAKASAGNMGGDGGRTNDYAATATEVPTNANYNPATQVYNAIGRREGLTNAEEARTANYLSNAVQSASKLEDLLATPGNTGSTSVYNSVYGNSSTTAGDYWMNILGNAMQMAMDAGDATAFVQLYSMYQDELSKQEKSSTSQVKLSDTQKRANAAMDSLERLSQMTPDLGYNLSNIPLIGGIATFGGNDYEAEAKSLAQQIGYMVSGSNIKEEEAYNIGKSYVPMPMDNEQMRRNKLQRAKAIIEKYQQTYAD